VPEKTRLLRRPANAELLAMTGIGLFTISSNLRHNIFYHKKTASSFFSLFLAADLFQHPAIIAKLKMVNDQWIISNEKRLCCGNCLLLISH